MKKTLAALGLTMICQFAAAGPMVEIYECELNEDKTLADLSEMMATFDMQFCAYIFKMLNVVATSDM